MSPRDSLEAPQYKESSNVIVSSNPLAKLKPEEWKNIPLCIVAAMRLIIETNDSND